MNRIEKKYRFIRKAAFAMAVIMIAEAVAPAAAFALTSGPGSPEFSSFEPVATTSMVNDFSGDFTYNLPVLNVPGANGGGYSMSLSYHSGASMEEEASWVGYGWTLNPGAINRGKRGFADDSKGDEVKYYNDVPANWTVGAGPTANLEFFSSDLVGLSLGASLRYNNYKGFSTAARVGIGFKDGLVSLGYNRTDGEGSFSVNVNPAGLMHKKNKELDKVLKDPAYKNGNQLVKAAMVAVAAVKDQKRFEHNKRLVGRHLGPASAYGLQALEDVYRATNLTPYVGESTNLSISGEIDLGGVPIGGTAGISGYYNIQENVPLRSLKTYGYMYSADASDADMMDYSVEKAAPYNKRDRYLSIPFSAADNYSVSGEGLAGGFRLHHTTPGHFFPNQVSSETTIGQASIEFHAATTVGPGLDIGIGKQTLEVGKNWDRGGSTYNGNTGSYAFASPVGDNYFFRFTNDLGGSVEYGGTDAATKASIYNDINVPGVKEYYPSISASDVNPGLTSQMDEVPRSGRSSYIGYRTNAELDMVASGHNYYEYSHDPSIAGHVLRSSVPDGIGEIATYNEDGERYVYALPVYSKNEKSMRYDLRGVPASSIEHNQIAYRNTASTVMKVGEEHSKPYATSYLLTEITAPNYVDRTLDGPTEDDLGGYTKFGYNRRYGTDDKNGAASSWYHWRIPYRGLQYDPGVLVDNMDDMGSESSGDKEVYYLQTVETKTHIAVFVTNKTSYTHSSYTFNGAGTISGTLNDRKDAMEADDDLTAASSNTAIGTKQLEYLERIELYAKPAGGSNDCKLLKTTYFSYDYSLCQNLPNSAGTGSDKGKLTLKKVWFEYEGTANARISPYQFVYEYPTTAYPSMYSSLGSFGGFSSAQQNPPYNPHNLDCWGSYQENGETRHDLMQNWVDQTPASSFDPAAWQLKAIKLPSGGEIHVQYEQKDYLYVQNRRAMSMVSLQSVSSDGKTFTLNTADIGVTSPTDKGNLVNLITSAFADEKIYFKIFYTMLGLAPQNIGSCDGDYVDGYASVQTAGIDGSGNVYITLNTTGGSDAHDLPLHVCRDYVKNEVGGKLKPLGDCNAASDGVDNSTGVEEVVQQLLSKVISFDASLVCMTQNPSISYLRVPVLHPKKGGGVRVKRILMYDGGIETGDAALYGSEYVYQAEDPFTHQYSSSGVASNEPASIREENALVTFLPKRDEQNFWQKASSGRDKEEFEGPIGESLLPGASVGHRRVVIKNIHSGKTNTGFAVNEYHTTYDYYFDKFYNTTKIYGNAVDATELEMERDIMYVPGGVVNVSIDNIWNSQGYRFVMNEMNGKPKTVATYAGDYANINNPAGCVLTSSTEYDYFEPGETIPMMSGVGAIEYANPGKEVEVVMERREVEDISKDGSIELDLSASVFLFIPFVTAFPMVNYEEKRLRQHVTTKVISYPAIVRSVTSMQDGIRHVIENKAFNPHTGMAVLTRTTDGFDQKDLELSSDHDGSYHSYSIPASSQYDNMGQKALGERMVMTSPAVGMTLAGSGSGPYSLTMIPSGSTDICNFMGSFTRGDFVRLQIGSSKYFFHVDGVVGNAITLLPAAHYTSSAPAGAVDVLEIINSGRTNQLKAMAGSFVTYGVKQEPTLQYSNGSGIPPSWNTFITNLNSIVNTGGMISAGTALQLTGGSCCEMATVSITNAGDQVTLGLTGCWPVLFTQVLTPDSGHFQINPDNSTIEYVPPGAACAPIPITVFGFCNPIHSFKAFNVVASSASIFDDNWTYDNNSLLNPFTAGLNAYETGMKGKWRTKSIFNYDEAITPGSWTSTSARIYEDAGVYPMVLFNWKYPQYNGAKWLKGTEVKKYSPHGEAIEEQNILGIYSAAKFGYHATLPYLVGANTDYASIQFESFENKYPSDKVEEGVALPVASQWDNTVAHSGASSYQLKNTGSPNNYFRVKNFALTQQMMDKGVQVKVWVRDPNYNPAPLSGQLKNTFNSYVLPLNFKKVASVGEWSLYSTLATGLAPSNFNLGNTLELTITNAYPSGPLKTIWIDDVRVQPYDAQVTTYVYDVKTLRLLASFDDQHFGLFYQYNAEGKLVRKLVETERGMKTVQETQYHTPLQSR